MRASGGQNFRKGLGQNFRNRHLPQSPSAVAFRSRLPQSPSAVAFRSRLPHAESRSGLRIAVALADNIGLRFFFTFPLTRFRKPLRGTSLTFPKVRACGTQRRHERRHRVGPLRAAVRRVARGTGDPRRSRNACLYCPHGTRSLADIVLRRRAAPSPLGSARSVPSRRGRPRRSHWRGRQAPALRPRRLALDVRVLHRGPSPVRGRGLPPDRRRARLARASPPPRHAGRRPTAPDGHREAGAAPDPGEPRCPREARRPPVEAGDRGARGGDLRPARMLRP